MSVLKAKLQYVISFALYSIDNQLRLRVAWKELFTSAILLFLCSEFNWIHYHRFYLKFCLQVRAKNDLKKTLYLEKRNLFFFFPGNPWFVWPQDEIRLTGVTWAAGRKKGRWQKCLAGIGQRSYIICMADLSVWTRVAFVWASHESHFLFTSIHEGPAAGWLPPAG